MRIIRLDKSRFWAQHNIYCKRSSENSNICLTFCPHGSIVILILIFKTKSYFQCNFYNLVYISYLHDFCLSRLYIHGTKFINNLCYRIICNNLGKSPFLMKGHEKISSQNMKQNYISIVSIYQFEYKLVECRFW